MGCCEDTVYYRNIIFHVDFYTAMAHKMIAI